MGAHVGHCRHSLSARVNALDVVGGLPKRPGGDERSAAYALPGGWGWMLGHSWRMKDTTALAGAGAASGFCRGRKPCWEAVLIWGVARSLPGDQPLRRAGWLWIGWDILPVWRVFCWFLERKRREVMAEPIEWMRRSWRGRWESSGGGGGIAGFQ